ncbi:methyltransferase domain-containing protein [Micrococcales bacterium 31B]|nr:methyltransferase domain-containing protein [Micrococcales bacterium 31B]
MTSRAPKATPQRRRAQAAAYRADQANYHDVRPGYPPEVFAALAPYLGESVVDIGAGTGKFTADLPAGAVAIEPSEAMRAEFERLHPQFEVRPGSAESTGLADASVHLATFAQTWHWVDVPRACAELDRVLTASGHVAVVWNQLDTEVAWVKRYTRISRSGDIFRRGDRPPLTAPFEWVLHRDFAWVQRLTPADLIALAQTRSFYLAADGTARERVLANLDWYLHLHLGFAPGQVVEVPYVTTLVVGRRMGR